VDRIGRACEYLVDWIHSISLFTITKMILYAMSRLGGEAIMTCRPSHQQDAGVLQQEVSTPKSHADDDKESKQ